MGTETQQNRGIGSEIQSLLQRLGLESHVDEIMRIATQAELHPESALGSVQRMDQNIPGLGLHNIDARDENGKRQSPYMLADRPIFRPI